MKFNPAPNAAKRESDVRYYSRLWPAVFAKAKGSEVWDSSGCRHIDFFSSAGTLNFGHNHPAIRDEVISYLQGDGIVSSLDLFTEARQYFIDRLYSEILTPLELPYVVQFTGPTGADAVEASLKLALKLTGRRKVVAFSGGYHGMTAAAISVSHARREAARRYYANAPFQVEFLPFGEGPAAGGAVEALAQTLGRGDRPAAVIVESFQCEGGVRIADHGWLRQLSSLCSQAGTLLILDEIQSGMGRTGTVFGFQHAGIVPDIVVVSKSLGGLGLPIAVLLLREDLDGWEPGEHSGTFRGSNLSFVAGAAALDLLNGGILAGIAPKAAILESRLREIAEEGEDRGWRSRGAGMLWGLDLADGILARACARRAFETGLLVELSGPHDEVVKVMPPLTIPEDLLRGGLEILCGAVRSCGGRS